MNTINANRAMTQLKDENDTLNKKIRALEKELESKEEL